jgi:integrase
LAVVLTPGTRGKPRPYSFSYAKRIAREARHKAGLPEHLTMAACRHGGMTELGDAALTEAQTMALSGHKTPEAARMYVKRTETQRVTAARRRRAWVETERSADKSQNGNDEAVSE